MSLHVPVLGSAPSGIGQRIIEDLIDDRDRIAVLPENKFVLCQFKQHFQLVDFIAGTPLQHIVPDRLAGEPDAGKVLGSLPEILSQNIQCKRFSLHSPIDDSHRSGSAYVHIFQLDFSLLPTELHQTSIGDRCVPTNA